MVERRLSLAECVMVSVNQRTELYRAKQIFLLPLCRNCWGGRDGGGGGRVT